MSSYDNDPVIQPRCPGCLVEHYCLNVLAVSHGAPCPGCGHAHVYENVEDYRRALRLARAREASEREVIG